MEGYGNENPGAFQPTRPLRGATGGGTPSAVIVSISTHAPLAGRDSKNTQRPCGRWYFNPRAPCGARPISAFISSSRFLFQPTRPLRGATGYHLFHLCRSDNFNPRAPCGARLFHVLTILQIIHISTHAPLAGRDNPPYRKSLAASISTHAPLAGRDGILRSTRAG